MTDITCHIKDCLHNKRNKCTANAIVLGSKGNCKAKAFAKDMMKHSRKQHWRGGMYGARATAPIGGHKGTPNKKYFAWVIRTPRNS